MNTNHLHQNVGDCQDNHETKHYDPSLDAYICDTCESEFTSFNDFELQEEDDEYALHIGI